MSTVASGSELVIYAPQEIDLMAQRIAESKLFPGITQAGAFALILRCLAEGRHPGMAPWLYHVIQGRPSMKAEAVLAEFQARGGSVDWLEHDETKCRAHFSHPKTCPKGKTTTWTIKDAERAGLTGKDVWKRHPRNMLMWRCVYDGIRAVYPGIIIGIYSPDEIEEITGQTIDITPSAAPGHGATNGNGSSRHKTLPNEWRAFNTRILSDRNDAWDSECRAAGVKDRGAWARLCSSPPQLTNALITTALASPDTGILPADVEQAEKPGTRDPKKAAAVAAQLYEDQREWTVRACEEYFALKLREAREALGLPGSEAPEDASQEVYSPAGDPEPLDATPDQWEDGRQ